jgi:hypothetical protein
MDKVYRLSSPHAIYIPSELHTTGLERSNNTVGFVSSDPNTFLCCLQALMNTSTHAHTQALTHTHTRTQARTHTHTQARAHTHTQARAHSVTLIRAPLIILFIA